MTPISPQHPWDLSEHLTQLQGSLGTHPDSPRHPETCPAPVETVRNILPPKKRNQTPSEIMGTPSTPSRYPTESCRDSPPLKTQEDPSEPPQTPICNLQNL